MIVIDMLGNDDENQENSRAEQKIKRLENERKKLIERQRAWQDYLQKSPQLQIIPVTDERR